MCGKNIGIFFSVIVVFSASVRADGPQFTGLLQDYFGSGGDLRRHSSIATIDKNGAVGPAIPLAGERWSDVIKAPNGFYYAIEDSSAAYRIDPATLVPTELPITGVNVDTDWLVGLTWDTTRNRLVVGSLSGEGFLFGYIDASNQWNVISSLHQTDLRSIAYRPSNDTIYGLKQEFVGATNTIYKYDANGVPVGQITLSQAIGDETPWGLDWQMSFASDGQLAVIGTEWVNGSFGVRTGIRSNLYLINPDSGAVTYQGVLPVPEPGMIGLGCAAVIYFMRRRR